MSVEYPICTFELFDRSVKEPIVGFSKQQIIRALKFFKLFAIFEKAEEVRFTLDPIGVQIGYQIDDKANEKSVKNNQF